jgi:hypothetical protein
MIKEGFKIPVDYFKDAMDGDPEGFYRLKTIQDENYEWVENDNDLHVYPYVHAVPAMLSAGCAQKCDFCPTSQYFKGTKYRADPERVLKDYVGQNVHFMDEDFFDNPDIDHILTLTQRYGIKFLAMSTYRNLRKMVDRYGERGLATKGLAVAEVGLENVALYKKVEDVILNPSRHFEILFLNMTYLKGETKYTIQANAEWMKERSLRNPIHFTNGMWYSPGQYLYNYGTHDSLPDRNRMSPPVSRSLPTFVPDSFLNEDFEINDLSRCNYYSQLVIDTKLYPEKTAYNVEEFLKCSEKKMQNVDYVKAMWLAIGLRVGGLK